MPSAHKLARPTGFDKYNIPQMTVAAASVAWLQDVRSEAQMANGLVWETVSWRSGEDRFKLDIERGGLFATLTAPGGRALTLPMVVWEGLLDAVKANRAAKSRGDQQFPARARARWYDGETTELADGFKSGRSIAQLAHAHNRTEYAIESQLDKLGLISTAEQYGPGAHQAGPQVDQSGHRFAAQDCDAKRLPAPSPADCANAAIADLRIEASE